MPTWNESEEISYTSWENWAGYVVGSLDTASIVQEWPPGLCALIKTLAAANRILSIWLEEQTNCVGVYMCCSFWENSYWVVTGPKNLQVLRRGWIKGPKGILNLDNFNKGISPDHLALLLFSPLRGQKWIRFLSSSPPTHLGNFFPSSFLSLCCFGVWDRVSFFHWVWPGTLSHPSSCSRVQGLQIRATTPDHGVSSFNVFIIMY